MAPIFRCVSRHKGLKLVLSGGIINASEAEKIAVMNRVYSRERLHESTSEMASEIASKSAIVLKLILEAHYTMLDMEYFKAIGEVSRGVC